MFRKLVHVDSTLSNDFMQLVFVSVDLVSVGLCCMFLVLVNITLKHFATQCDTHLMLFCSLFASSTTQNQFCPS